MLAATALPRERLVHWHISEELIRRGNVRIRGDSVAKLGKRRLTRNNRIGAKDLLNRCCALVAVLESMLPARATQNSFATESGGKRTPFGATKKRRGMRSEQGNAGE